MQGDLWPSGDPELEPIVLKGKSIRLQGDPAAKTRATIWCRYVPRGEPAGLVLDADRIELHNIRWVGDPNKNGPGPGQWAAALLLKSGGQVEVSDCEFLQGNVGAGSLFHSLAVEARPSLKPASVLINNCCFLAGTTVRHPIADEGWLTEVGKSGGQTAVIVRGAATVRASNCAFGPHAALFRFPEGPERTLTLNKCTALAGDDWTLAAVGDASVKVDASSCFFGRTGSTPDAMAMMNERKPLASLLRLNGPGASGSSYQGTSNRYLNLDAVRLFGTDDAAPAADTFAKQLLDPTIDEGNDEKVLSTNAQPWKADPIALLQGALTPQNLLTAFTLDSSHVPELRYGPKSSSVVGLEDSPWGRRVWTTPLPPVAAALVKVVDPKAKETDSVNGIYKSLEEASHQAQIGRHHRDPGQRRAADQPAAGPQERCHRDHSAAGGFATGARPGPADARQAGGASSS